MRLLRGCDAAVPQRSIPHQQRDPGELRTAEILARRLLFYPSVMRHAPPSRQAPNLIVVACLVTVFMLGLAMIGAHSAVATAAETDCVAGRDQTVLVGLAGNTLSLLAKEALGLIKIGAGTMATLTLAIAQNLGGIGLWAYTVYVAMMGHMALVVAGALLLSVVYARKAPRR
jgi:hypothetical protein